MREVPVTCAQASAQWLTARADSGTISPGESTCYAQEALKAYDAVSPGDDLAENYGEDVEVSGPGRRAGVLLHPTSLPGPYGCGEIGREAFRFIDWLVTAGMQVSLSDDAGPCRRSPLPCFKSINICGTCKRVSNEHSRLFSS